MRSYSPAALSHLQSGGAVRVRLLFWIVARNRLTGAQEALGLWNGDDHQQFEIGGHTRTYYGAGPLISIPTIMLQVGLNVRMQEVQLSANSPEVLTAIEQYDARQAPVEIHRALTDPDTHALIDEPHRIFKGWCDSLELPTPAMGEEAVVRLQLASSAQILTRTLSTKYSDEAQQRRSGDRFMRYSDLSGEVPVYWGEKRA